MNLLVHNTVEKKVQKIARIKENKTHEFEMKKLDKEVRLKRARQEDYSELIGQQVLQ
jgi:hypothetical protein